MKKLLLALALAALSSTAFAEESVCSDKLPWKMPAKPGAGDDDKVSQIDIVLNAPGTLTTVCYCNGKDGSFVDAASTVEAGAAELTRIYIGGCAYMGAKSIRLSNPNSEPALGAFEVAKPVEPK